MRFSVVGIFATIIHISIAVLLITQNIQQPIIANLIAFMIAFIFSFSGQYYWTFGSQISRQKALFRFFLVSIIGFIANNLTLLGFLTIDIIPEAHATMISALVIPIISYLLSRFWAFQGDIKC